MSQENLSKYIRELLEERGGKAAGWHKKKLADESGLSYSHISWIVDGKAFGKKGPPAITLDTLKKLSDVLKVPPMHIYLAYHGKQPP